MLVQMIVSLTKKKKKTEKKKKKIQKKKKKKTKKKKKRGYQLGLKEQRKRAYFSDFVFKESKVGSTIWV